MITRKAVIVIGPSIAYIPLTKGYFTCVDVDRAKELEQWNWFIARSGTKGFYAMRNVPGQKGRGRILMHRQLLGLNPGDSTEGDHVHRDGLQNRMAALRVSTHQQNQWNRGKKVTNKTGFTGVRPSPCGHGFRAQIKIDGKCVHLGTRETAKEAGMLYELAAARLHGEFKRID